MKKTLSGIKAAIALAALTPVFAFAQTSPNNPQSPSTQASGGLVNPLSVSTLDGFLTAILNGIVQIGTIILIMMLVYVGFLFVAARGNAEKLQGAKSALVWTVIGGLILLGATAIQLVITGTVNSVRP